MRRSKEALAAEVEAFETEPGMLLQLIGLAQEKGLLVAMAWVAAEPDVDRQDFARLRRLLPHRQLGAAVRKLFAGEAGYALAYDRSQLADADVAQLLEGYRRLPRLPGARPRRGPAGRHHGSRALRPIPIPCRQRSLPLSDRTLNPPSSRSPRSPPRASWRSWLSDLRLAAARGCAYPETLEALPLASEPDPFTARRPRYAREAQGGATLSNPSAAAAWDALPHCAKTKPPPYVWHLPPPCASAALSRGP